MKKWSAVMAMPESHSTGYPGVPAGTAFRVVALVEACTWAGLLAGMAVKYLGSGNETGVHIFGPMHGAAFIAYVVVALWAAWRLGWSRGVTLFALAASIPPLATWAFEMWCRRTGRLARLRRGRRTNRSAPEPGREGEASRQNR